MGSLCGQYRCANFSSMITTCGMSVVVMCREKAALNQRNLHGAKIIRAGSAHDLPATPVRAAECTLYMNASPSHRSSQRQHGNRTFRHHSGKMGDRGSRIRCRTGHRFVLVVYFGPLATTCMVSTRSVVNPGGTLCNRTKLRISSPAPISSIERKREFRNYQQASQAGAVSFACRHRSAHCGRRTSTMCSDPP